MLNAWLNLKKIKDEFPIGCKVFVIIPEDKLTVKDYSIESWHHNGPKRIKLHFEETRLKFESSYVKKLHK